MTSQAASIPLSTCTHTAPRNAHPSAIPVELLQEILQFSCFSSSSHPLIQPLLLSHVCRWWRAVAHSTPELWTTLVVEDYGFWTSDLSVEMTRAWLERSGNRLLNLHVKSTVPVRTEARTSGYDVLRLLQTHVLRIRELSLEVGWSYTRALLGCVPRLPELRQLSINIHPSVDFPGTTNPEMDVSIPSIPPNLADVSLRGVALPTLLAQPFFSRITSLNIVLSEVNLDTVLAHCTQLRHLTLHTKFDPRHQRSTSALPVITHKALETLSVLWEEHILAWSTSDALLSVVKRLVLPRLRAFEVCFMAFGSIGQDGKAWPTYEIDWRSMDALGSFCVRSGSELNRINVRGFMPSQDVAFEQEGCSSNVLMENETIYPPPSVLYELAPVESQA